MSIDIESGVRLDRGDWPAPGPIDLGLHDLPHASAGIEWWYVNAHLVATDGRRFGLFAAFFRINTAAGDAEPSYQHFLSWALADPAGQRYFPHTRMDRRTPETVLEEFDAGRGPGDERIRRALREVVEQGRIPLPDRLLTRDARVASDRLALDFDGDCFVKHADGSYDLDLSSEPGGCSCRLHFVLEKPIVRHGDDGFVRGLGGERMFYYFSPRCRVDGFLTLDGVPLRVDGSGWYDHEFGEKRPESDDGLLPTVGWNWLSAQLENGWDVTAYDLFEKADASRSRGRWVILIDPRGERHAYSDFAFEALDPWTSTRTFNEYPTRYRLEVEEAGLSLDIGASLPDQELITLMAPPAFWEGLVTVTGTMSGRPVAGRGFVERSGVSVVDTTDDFFASVGRETRRAIEALLPAQPDAGQALAMIGGPRREHFLESVDLEQYSRTLVAPIREIILRGGKSWRSYSILCCMDLVGGNSQPFADWLALPELLHVGSLIIDDVQDRSEVRRGGLSCHRLYGEALAINAGCASYFLAQIPVGASRLDDSMRARIYEAYFEALRAGHAGQAFDIAGLADLMPQIVENGDGERLERRVLAVHRLKSAAPAGALARMSALIGGGTEEQAEGLGRLFESFGVAFQIVDDVLNLRGFDENRKQRGEDIMQGKITAPVAKAMGRLSRRERERLWAILASQPDDPRLIGEAIALIDGCGALDASDADARALVESTWQSVSPLVPDSQFKVRLRAFGWFILDRHY
jgi:geranylgeranyl pyrophosphate synthase/predicted secreted hydrolase